MQNRQHQEEQIDTTTPSKKILIRCFDDYISVREEVDGEFISLRKLGEEKFKYDDGFWKWFKKKIGYRNELLSFDVVSDMEDFSIDSEINVALFNLSKEEIILENPLSSTHTMPKKPIKKESLSEYYNNKTKLFRGE